MTEQETGGRPNKSAKKREIEALHVLAEQMVALSDQELARLGVDARLREALAQVRPMRVSGARNRQLKHCVKFMDADDLAPVSTYLNDRQAFQLAENQRFHRMEQWRDRLIGEGDDALGALITEYPETDRQRLRQLTRDAMNERESGKPAGAGRKLFRYLREDVFRDNS